MGGAPQDDMRTPGTTWGAPQGDMEGAPQGGKKQLSCHPERSEGSINGVSASERSENGEVALATDSLF